MQITTMNMSESLARLQKHFIGLDNFNTQSHYNDASGFPPFNIEKLSAETYRLTLAIAGFAKDQVSIVVEGSILRIKGSKPSCESTDRVFIHQGIAERDFWREFRLMANTFVESAEFKDGLLDINIKYEVPETLKLRSIDIK